MANRKLIIIPAYNEADSIASVVTRLHDCLPDFDVVVIDDGSRDNTAALVPPTARVISLPFNLGIGGAMQTGYRYAARRGYQVAVQVDADGQHPPELVSQLVNELESSGADMIVGSRFLEPGLYEQSFTRMGGIKVLRALIRIFTGVRITDCTSGFRAMNGRVIRAFAHWYPEDYPEPEVVLLLLRAGLKVRETPTRMNQRTTGQTSIPFWRGVFYVIKVSACLMLDLIREPWRSARIEAP